MGLHLSFLSALAEQKQYKKIFFSVSFLADFHQPTWNLKDFPAAIVDGFAIAVQSPDDFLYGLLVTDTPAVVQTLREMRRRLNRPSMDIAGFLDALERNRLLRTRTFLMHLRAEL